MFICNGGNLSLQLHTNFDMNRDETLCRATDIPIRSPNWMQKAELTDGNESRPIRMPRPPRNLGLVFKTDSGVGIRQWHLGEEYYVLIVKQDLDSSAANIVFEEWFPLGSPEGDWDAYELLWVRVKDPFQELNSTPDAVTLRSILSLFENATDSLNLPSFGHISSTRLYLIGGSRLREAYREDTYAVDSPPLWVEIRGVWAESFTLTLSKWCDGDDSFNVLSEIRLPRLNLNETHLVDIWGTTDACTGLYRLEVSSRHHVSFHLIARSNQELNHRFEVSLKLQDEMGLHGDTLTLRDLDQGTLVASAWPMAELSLTETKGLSTRTVSILADETGIWKKRWRDLGIGRVLDGKLDVTLSWRGVVYSHLTFASAPFVADGDLEWRWEGRDNAVLKVSGKISNLNQECRASIVVVGSQPWNGQMWQEMVRLDKNCQFTIQLNSDRDVSQWLMILPVDFTEGAGDPWAIENVSSNSGPGYCLKDCVRGGQWEDWHNIAGRLKGLSVPPGLHEIINVHTLGIFLREHAATLSLQAKWTTVERSDVFDRLASWEPFGFQPPKVLLQSKEMATEITVNNLLPPFLTVESLNKIANKSRGEHVPATCVMREWSEREIASTLRAKQMGTEISFEIQAAMDEYIYCCSKCGLALPSNLFSSHVPPNGGECAARMGEAFATIQPGERALLQIGILIDPSTFLTCITCLIERLISENAVQAIPSYADCWLDQLEAVYIEQGEQRQSWIVELLDNAQALWSAIHSDGEPNLEELGRQVALYEDGLAILYKWLLDEYRSATT